MSRASRPTAPERSPVSDRSGGRVLVIDDEEIITATLQEFLLGEGFEVAVAGDGPAALLSVERFEPDVVLCDIQLPGLDGLDLLERLILLRPELMVLMMTAYATVDSAVVAFRRGAQDYLMKPVLFDDLLSKIDRLIRFRRLTRENQAMRRQLHANAGLDAMVGASTPMQGVKTLVRKIGPTRSNVLVTGESGTGKELVARALHAEGREPDTPFLAINCAAIPTDLLENQLFGHVRGAFTGADRDRVGLFVAAGRGTVFLDEIGELPMLTQAKLLRAIEAKEVLPVGATRTETVAARVIAATNKDLAAEALAGRFRADLFYRLNVVAIPLPPLRDRRDDIPALIAVLLDRHARSLGRRIDGVDNAAVRRLAAAPWRGNVRELGNALERAVILADGPTLSVDDFPLDLVAPADDDLAGFGAGLDADSESDDLRAATERFERQHIRRVLDRLGGDKKEAARRLGLGLSSLYRKLDGAGAGDDR